MSYVSVHEYRNSYEITVSINVNGEEVYKVWKTIRKNTNKQVKFELILRQWFRSCPYSLSEYRNIERILMNSANGNGWKIVDLPAKITKNYMLWNCPMKLFKN